MTDKPKTTSIWLTGFAFGIVLFFASSFVGCVYLAITNDDGKLNMERK